METSQIWPRVTFVSGKRGEITLMRQLIKLRYVPALCAFSHLVLRVFQTFLVPWGDPAVPRVRTHVHPETGRTPHEFCLPAGDRGTLALGRLRPPPPLGSTSQVRNKQRLSFFSFL